MTNDTNRIKITSAPSALTPVPAATTAEAETDTPTAAITAAKTDRADAATEHRNAFVDYLYGLGAAVDSPNTAQQASARRTLAILRRGFTGGRQEIEAYDVVFDHDPPPAEQHVWLLVAGLFAVYPHRHPSPGARRTLAGALGQLALDRGESVQRRFLQLVSVSSGALPHYARQAVQLLRTTGIPLDYRQLLPDLIALMDDTRPERAHRIRLDWARAFHRAHQSRPSRAGRADTRDDG
jgi:CRISPR system Cascade subunit CasB